MCIDCFSSSLPNTLQFLQLNLLEKMEESYCWANHFLMPVARFMLFSLVVKKIRGNPLFPSISMSLILCVSTITLAAVSAKVCWSPNNFVLFYAYTSLFVGLIIQIQFVLYGPVLATIFNVTLYQLFNLEELWYMGVYGYHLFIHMDIFFGCHVVFFLVFSCHKKFMQWMYFE
jgi:hypothetical protein